LVFVGGWRCVEPARSIGRAGLVEMMAKTYVPPVNAPGADILRYFDLL
jgi:hypothetical protein